MSTPVNPDRRFAPTVTPDRFAPTVTPDRFAPTVTPDRFAPTVTPDRRPFDAVMPDCRPFDAVMPDCRRQVWHPAKLFVVDWIPDTPMAVWEDVVEKIS